MIKNVCSSCVIKSCSFPLYFYCSSAVHKLGELKLGHDFSLKMEEKREPGKGEPGKEEEPEKEEDPGKEGKPVKCEPGEMLKSSLGESTGEI